MTAIRRYEMDLYRRLVDGLEAIPGLTLYGITDRSRFEERTPTAALRLEGSRREPSPRRSAPRGSPSGTATSTRPA